MNTHNQQPQMNSIYTAGGGLQEHMTSTFKI